MSRYFDALNRLRKGREASPTPDLHLAGEAEPTPVTLAEPAAGPGLPFPELQLASRQSSYAALLDLLRAATKASPIPAVVIAGVSGSEPVREIVAGIDLQAQHQGISLKCGHHDLTTGARVLHLSSSRPLRGSSSPSPAENRESLRLTGSHAPDALGKWLEQAAAGSDLLLIEAPPLGVSLEAALLGGACEGLVLVAEALATKRWALRESVERSRLAGCEILGLVLTGTRSWLPNWIGRLVDLVSRS